jgi:hypothetical protein
MQRKRVAPEWTLGWGAEEVLEDVFLAVDRAEREYLAKKRGIQQATSEVTLRKQPKTQLGLVRVAKYYPGKPQPETQGYRNILIHTSAAAVGGPLSPYVLRNEQGHLLENVWQFSKLYTSVTKQRTPLSRFQPSNIIWEHPAEVHLDSQTGKPTAAYWAWRAKGMSNAYAVRYPNGFKGRKDCVCSIWPGNADDQDERLTYIEARKRIYCGEYARLAPPTASFKRLRALLEQGVNLQIVEVDGPDPSLTFAPYDQISTANPGLLMTEQTIRLLINDARKPFGHGFVIAALLLGGQEWMQ